jgi:hypothetical protein
MLILDRENPSAPSDILVICEYNYMKNHIFIN